MIRLIGPVAGTRLGEWRWSKRTSFSSDYGWETLNHPHRLFIADHIADLGFEFKTFLEVGCGVGPNLYLLARRYPGVEFTGVDINPSAVEAGNERMRRDNIRNVRLSVCKADALEYLPEYDIVLTDAALMYIGPDKIRQVVGEISRIARLAVVLCEWHTPEPVSLGRYERNWVRNYTSLLMESLPDAEVKVFWLGEKGGFDDALWKKYGAIVVATPKGEYSPR